MSADGQQQQPGTENTRLVIRTRPLPPLAAAPALPAPEYPAAGEDLAIIKKTLQSGSDEASLPVLSGRAHVIVDGQRETFECRFHDETEELFDSMGLEEMRVMLKDMLLHTHAQEITTQSDANLLMTINKGALDLYRQVQVLQKKSDESQNQEGGGSIGKEQKAINKVKEIMKKDHKRVHQIEAESRKQAAKIVALKSTAEEQAAEIVALKSTAERQAAQIQALRTAVGKLLNWAEAKEHMP